MMQQKIRICLLTIVSVVISTSSLKAQEPPITLERIPISFPDGYQPEECKLHQSPDLGQLWWVCSGTLRAESGVLFFIPFSRKGQPERGILLHNQNQELKNFPINLTYLWVMGVSNEGNFLLYDLKNYFMFGLKFIQSKPKIVWQQKSRSQIKNSWAMVAAVTVANNFVILWQDVMEIEEKNIPDNQALLQELNGDGELNWAYEGNAVSVVKIANDSFDLEELEDINMSHILDDQLLSTPKGQLIVWGNRYSPREVHPWGEFYACFTSTGKLIKEEFTGKYNKQFDQFEEQNTVLATQNNNGWIAIRATPNNREDINKLESIQFNEQCQKISSRIFDFPDHHTQSKILLNNVKAALTLPNGELLIAYTQGKISPESLYLAKLDGGTGIIWDQPLILPTDLPQEDALISRILDPRVKADQLEVNMKIMPDATAVLISVSNTFWPASEANDNYLNKIYLVRLP